MAEDGENGFAVMHDHRLGDLELEPVRRNSRTRQRADNDWNKLLAPELSGRQVDRDPDMRGPFGGFGTGGSQDPFSQRHDQAGLLRERDEFARHDQTLLRVMPA